MANAEKREYTRDQRLLLDDRFVEDELKKMYKKGYEDAKNNRPCKPVLP